MSNVTTFNHLPNELIICIFSYLDATETFQAFFDCNHRCRKLVKHYVNYDRHALDKDIERFSTLHSWYKHLGFVDSGTIFYMAPLKGEQERYNFSPCVSDRHGIHWHFWREKTMPLVDKRIEQISQKYPIKLNPFFHPNGGGWNQLYSSQGRDFLRQHYPSQFEVLATTIFQESYSHFYEALEFYTDDVARQMKAISESERKRLRKTIHGAAQRIWKEIQALDDVNILEIQYTQKTAGFVMLVTLNKFD
ncbi:unnamed protein product [Rotaria sordida]|uniref:F-box domain-containing protein n=1 Tax=Rotaria sordida TaxID=392033 RepID=A0A814W5Q2_9BILA|nr:unnamed protein product [Rotaria sordida]CAF3758997.1 unnamed protein product [Rotaria sordida]